MMEKIEYSLVLFSFITPFCLLSNTAIGVDPLFTFCSNDTSNYQFNSTYEINLKHVLESLISNTSLTGFNNTFIGDSPDRVYGQALCRGDVNSTVCHSCIKNASEEILKVCKSREAIIWYEQCQVRYSFQMFFLTMVYTGKFPDWDSQQSYISNPAHFNEVLMYLMNNLSSEAANVPEKNMFATGEIKFSGTKTIYGLVQCTRDSSLSDCSACLKNALGDLNACCYLREGGIVLSRNCNARFQLDRFYNSSSFLVTYPASKGNNLKTWIIAAIACISTLILAVLIGSSAVCIRNRRSDKDKEKCEQAFLNDLSSPTHGAVTQESDLTNTEELPFFDLVSIIAATDNFSNSNKLGQGGFGAVYKGVLSDGKEVAVKRLSRTSWQGLEEFKNEVKLIAKLQHRNLVRLLGYGVEGDEKLLIYEFMPNRSLDIFTFGLETTFIHFFGIICRFVRITCLDVIR
ncbi:hypothetical protein HS088_TW09G00243 [Tripterygium wilfordii]|uniref:Cysteine-rich receptor-like protein kinase 25 n=1 Tax=Tripterygium wilfordii TaxID=458696 RepID=A0A7J7D751_TRIWF|nr:hypothetical protein HS088_TW09G00243 [Tripterygium wilfordii]